MAASTSRGRIAAAILSLLLAALSPDARAQQASWSLETIKLPAPAVRLHMSKGRPIIARLRIETGEGRWLYLKSCGEALCAEAFTEGYRRAPPPSDALPDAETSGGRRNIAAAWLASPTRRYAHGVLGDAVEAETVVVLDKQRQRHRFTLPHNSVFEDRLARIADLDGDGEDEIVVVRSYLAKGAALAVLRLLPHGLGMVAETPPIGRPHRWLNPAGIADYDGDKRNEIAVVVTPHLGGTLEFWELRDGKLRREMQLKGFSNHVIGSRVQAMSASADFDGDGITDLALPSDDRKTLRIISLAGGAAAEVARIPLPGRVVTEIITVKVSGAKRPALVMGLDTGELAVLR